MSTPGPLGLYDLLAPQFLLGFSFPEHIDKYLSLLSVAEFQSTSDENAILYTGTVYFPSAPGQPPALPQHTDPSGAIYDFHDDNFRFRLLIPRTGAHFISTAVNDIPALVFPPSLQPLKDNVFGSSGSPSGPSDAPGVAFELDLLLNLLTFHLGPHWLPAVQNSDFTISPNPGSPPKSDVRILLPQILLKYTQSQDFSKAPDFEVAAWGDPGFDAGEARRIQRSHRNDGADAQWYEHRWLRQCHRTDQLLAGWTVGRTNAGAGLVGVYRFVT